LAVYKRTYKALQAITWQMAMAATILGDFSIFSYNVHKNTLRGTHH